MSHFKYYNKKDILSITQIRKFETKLGERIQVIADPAHLEHALQENPAKFVIIGIPENIGVKANMGMGGTDFAWMACLSDFLNIQSNDFLEGSNIMVLGHFDFSDMEKLIDQHAHDYEEQLAAYRHAVYRMDEEVEQMIDLLTQNNKTPIIIGGGHNNSYPCIKGAAKGFYKAGLIPIAQINAINLDAHADFRPMEGRHSENGFTYAEADGYLEKYFVIGLQENYLPQNVWMDMVNNPFVDCITYEDIFLHEKRSFRQAVGLATDFTNDTLCGIEIDLDVIENILGSPTGISPNHARQFIQIAVADSKVAYLLICEGALQSVNGYTNSHTGKLISSLVSDFVKSSMIN